MFTVYKQIAFDNNEMEKTGVINEEQRWRLKEGGKKVVKRIQQNDD